MKLIEELIAEAGGDPLGSVTFVPGSCAYVKSVKSVTLITPTKIVFARRKQSVSVEGENLRLEGYFESDALVAGEVKRVELC